MEDLQAIDQVTTTAIDLAFRFGPRVLVAILFLIAGYVCGGWAARVTGRALESFHLDPPVQTLLERVVRLLVLGLFAIIALQNLGIELLPLIAGLGVAGAGIALAMQGVLANVAAGLTIIFTRPYRVGDYISIAQEEGEVLEIGLFDTVLGHPDLSRVIIPNRKIAGEILHNYGKIRQLVLEVGLPQDADVPAALAAIDETLRADPKVLRDPAPVVILARLAETRIVIGIMPWVQVPDVGPATGALNQSILDILRRRGIPLASPRMEVLNFAADAANR
jgi:small conductance mechanosensitive channel